MTRLISSNHNSSSGNYYEIAVLLFALLLQICSRPATSRSTVEFLPGFQGPLPFELETGYVGVGQSEEVQVFYYFFKSENNPKDDPLLLWLSGGPGCSSITGLAFEIGPLAFIDEEYNGSLPRLALRPQSWTKVSSIIFVDLPAGTGFTYAKTEAATQQGDLKLCHHAHQFLRKWLIDHPEYLSNQVYLSGNSYAGIPIPALLHEVSNEQSLQKNCKGEYIKIDPNNLLCSRDFQSFQENTAEVDKALILDRYCGYDLRMPPGSFWKRSLAEKIKANNLNSPTKCRETVKKWIRCNRTMPFKFEINSSFPYHVNLSTKGYRSLIYSGDHDMLVPFSSTQAWIRSLNYSIVDDWRPWYVNGQIAGYTRTYSNRMTFATVKGAGHTAAEFKPEECLAMLIRWMSNRPL